MKVHVGDGVNRVHAGTTNARTAVNVPGGDEDAQKEEEKQGSKEKQR